MKYYKTCQWVKEHLEDPNIIIVEATIFFNKDKPNTPEFLISGEKAYQNSHIPHAIFVDQFALSLSQAPIPFTPEEHDNFVEYMLDKGIDGSKPVIIYDRGPLVGSNIPASYWASRLAWQMMYEGFEEVYVLEGGWQKWLELDYPVSAKQEILASTGIFTGQRQTQYLADRAEVEAALNNENYIIVDALTADQYSGQMAPFGQDRAGHIPGAVNIGFDTLTDPITREFYHLALLEKQLKELGVLNPHKRVILYCGFGVAATWIWLFIKELGQNNVAIYDASMTDWALNTQLPIEK